MFRLLNKNVLQGFTDAYVINALAQFAEIRKGRAKRKNKRRKRKKGKKEKEGKAN